ncbi:BgTH12-05013 [Blumeria graminis f. sp. triticale]|uniref:BgTH12-05013 n=1 Tax=Blumeria graminis f. sp. triticale TaxID=1689686 RepID=A0A9W4DM18_BLUGR|nr:BgTH12-05013 [Blumeria graminis f. sp. triticale]
MVMKRLWCFAVVTALTCNAIGEPFTKRHEAGRCAIRGNCGGGSLFSPPVPCSYNGQAEEPATDVREKLVELCGSKWSSGPVCCEESQIQSLSDNLNKAKNFISACPACKENFFNLFCTFTCSPDQSLFLNVTQANAYGTKLQVAELDQLLDTEYGSGLFDSCKDVKFGPTNTNAIDFIGGGANSYVDFLNFLGKKNPPFGSPFQINFPDPNYYKEKDMKPQIMIPKECNDEDDRFRCACVDCLKVCPALPEISRHESCHVGRLPCLSFGAIIVYSILSLFFIIVVSNHAVRIKQARRSEHLRLLQDTSQCDEDDDEGDMIHEGDMCNRPYKIYWLNTLFDSFFSRLGYVAARFPGVTILSCVIIVGILSLGCINFEIERDPARLWVSPNSASAKEKAFFDANFGPFYRVEQVILINDTKPSGPGPVLSFETLQWWINIEKKISKIKGRETGVSLDDVCFKPTGEACVIQSVSAYFENNINKWTSSTWKARLKYCIASPVNCLPDFGQPIDPAMILGGVDDSTNLLDSPAIITTWVITNYAEKSTELTKAMDWEVSMRSTLLELQEEAVSRGLRLSFSTEISLEEELNKSSNTDAKIIIISYLIMFFYASLALGSKVLSLRSILQNPTKLFIESKFTLGVAGILIVLMSISASIGLFSAIGIKITLIIAEVIPFIVLAVGVDNIFLIVHELENVNISHADADIESRIARALGRIGPSILLSAVTETIAFSLGTFVGMPAVRNFAVYAAGAVFINAILQVTMFISVLALNERRVENRRVDCFPCVRLKSIQLGSNNDYANGVIRPYEGHDESFLQRFICKNYAPTILGRKVKVLIFLIFMSILTASISLMPRVTLGLDQRDAVPADSYLIPYFNDIYDYLNTGPPVYFVTRQLNITERAHQQQICSRFTTCHQKSLTNILEQERKRPEISYIASTPASWLDDYFRWLDPTLSSCCIESNHVCFENRNPPWNITLYGMPEGEEFVHYLQKWIAAPTNEACPLGGQAPYSTSLVIDAERGTIPASHFRTSHTPLRSQDDFISAYASARKISDEISKANDIEVFPYSLFYIFFDQYTTIIKLAVSLLGSALALILLVSSILLGSFKTGAVITITVTMILVDIVGTMGLFRIPLNAVSLVNLVICVGIGVEFCAHVARAFMFPTRSIMERAQNKFHGRDARVWTALVNVGGSVFSGITVTKLLGVIVLAFTRSKIFEIYYFRIWLALVIFASTHALVFLPVALSVLGGSGYVDPKSDGGLEEDLASRRYRNFLPDVDDSDDED